MAWNVVLFYKYVEIDNPARFQTEQAELCKRFGLCGRLLIASEGVNGTLASLASDGNAVAQYCAALAQDPRFADVDWKTSESNTPPFPELSVRVVKEIVGYGQALAGVDPRNGGAGAHLDSAAFHKAVAEAAADPSQGTVLLDVRNAFEHEIGHFSGAVDLGMRITSDFAPWVEAHTDSLQGKNVLMYCTGGVRCEKASAYLKASVPGVGEVSQLSGGIHRYLEAFPDGGHFKGKNFVFDARVTMAPPLAAAAPVAGTADKSSDAATSKRMRTCGNDEGSSGLGSDEVDSSEFTEEHTAGGPGVIGMCGSCQAPYDQPRATDVCAVCRAVCLACDNCRRRDAELLCRDHRVLKGAYFWFLGPFTKQQLLAQKEALEAFIAVPKGSQKPGGWVGGSKRRGQTVRKQVGRVVARLRELEEEEQKHGADVTAPKGTMEWALAAGPDHPRRCRWCFHVLKQQVTERAREAAVIVSAHAQSSSEGSSSSVAGGVSGPACDGRCWGFWKAPVGSYFEEKAE